MIAADLRRRIRRLALVWLALIALLMTSLGSAYLSLGVFGWVPGVAIAGIKTAIVVRWFMRIDRASPWSRSACFTALCTLALLCGLGYFDGATRPHDAAAWQQPKQLPPARTR